jgi:hypothetical protein
MGKDIERRCEIKGDSWCPFRSIFRLLILFVVLALVYIKLLIPHGRYQWDGKVVEYPSPEVMELHQENPKKNLIRT